MFSLQVAVRIPGLLMRKLALRLNSGVAARLAQTARLIPRGRLNEPPRFPGRLGEALHGATSA